MLMPMSIAHSHTSSTNLSQWLKQRQHEVGKKTVGDLRGVGKETQAVDMKKIHCLHVQNCLRINMQDKRTLEIISYHNLLYIERQWS